MIGTRSDTKSDTVATTTAKAASSKSSEYQNIDLNDPGRLKKKEEDRQLITACAYILEQECKSNENKHNAYKV